MIVKEFFETRLDGVNLYKIYSTEGFYIKEKNTSNNFLELICIEEISSEDFIETSLKPKQPAETIEEPEIENGDQELTDEEAMELIKEVF